MLIYSAHYSLVKNYIKFCEILLIRVTLCTSEAQCEC